MKRKGVSYTKRVADINRIYDEYAKRGVPNREIWRRYVYPVYGICERSFYNILKAPCNITDDRLADMQLFLDFGFDDEVGTTGKP